MTMEAEKKFTTLDLYLASFILLQGIDPELQITGNKVAFLFEATDRLYRLMGLFNSNTNVPVADYTTALKILRGKMLSFKENIPGYENGRRYASRSS